MNLNIQRRKQQTMNREKITLTYEGGEIKATYEIELKEAQAIVEFVGESYSKLYSLLALDAGISTKILDDFSYEVDLDFKGSELGIKPEFENIDDFQECIEEDEGFRAFMYDMYKEAFYE